MNKDGILIAKRVLGKAAAKKLCGIGDTDFKTSIFYGINVRMMEPAIFKNRLKNIREQLKLCKLDSLLITTPANITYLAGFEGHDAWAFLTNRKIYLITDSRYTIAAKTQSPHCQIIERKSSLPAAFCDITAKLKSIKNIGIEQNITLSNYAAVKKHIKLKIKKTSGIIETARSIKDDIEIFLIKKAVRIAQSALEKTIGSIKPGISESALAATVDYNIQMLGAKSAFETIAAFGCHAACPHHQPSRRRLKKNDTILIDFGAVYHGYRSDLTRCFVIGRPPAGYLEAYKTLWYAQLAAIKAVKANAKIADVERAAKDVLAAANLPLYSHGTGHGLGLDVHEAPIVNAKAKGVLKTGQVITIEPGIYIEKKFGIRIEDDVLVCDDGYKILTKKLTVPEPIFINV